MRAIALRLALATVLAAPMIVTATASAQAAPLNDCTYTSKSRLVSITVVTNGPLCFAGNQVKRIDAALNEVGPEYGHFELTGPNGTIANSSSSNYGTARGVYQWSYGGPGLPARGRYCVRFWILQFKGFAKLDEACQSV